MVALSPQRIFPPLQNNSDKMARMSWWTMIGIPLLAGLLAMAISGFAHGEIQGLYRSVADKLQRRSQTGRKGVSYWLLALAYVGIVILLVIMAVRRTHYKKPKAVARFDFFHPTYELVLAVSPARLDWLNLKARGVYRDYQWPHPL